MSYTPTYQMQCDMKRREGFRLDVYADSKGLPTQGIGRHHGIQFGMPSIDEDTAYRWLQEDLQQGYRDALKLFPALDSFDIVRKESLIDLAFNMGGDKLAIFVPFIRCVNAQDWPSAHLHILTNTSQHLTPYLVQTGVRAVDVAGRIATGEIPKEFLV